VLYEALTGRVPFPGKNYHAVLHGVLFDAPENLASTGEVDAVLWDILERALTKDLAARTASMRELGVALAQWLVTQGVREDIAGGSLEKQWLADGDADHLVTVMPPASDVGRSSADSREWASGERASMRAVSRAATPVDAAAPARPKRWPLVLGAAAATLAALLGAALLRGQPQVASRAERAAAPAVARASHGDAESVVTPPAAPIGTDRAPERAARGVAAAESADSAAPASAPVVQRPARARPSSRRSKLRNPFER
jgi:hypothetical protein